MLQVAADDRDRRAVAVDVHVDVAIEVSDVEELFEEVGGDVALGLELRGIGAHLFLPFFFFLLLLLGRWFLAWWEGFWPGCF
jgi:hypothetical protein